MPAHSGAQQSARPRQPLAHPRRSLALACGTTWRGCLNFLNFLNFLGDMCCWCDAAQQPSPPKSTESPCCVAPTTHHAHHNNVSILTMSAHQIKHELELRSKDCSMTSTSGVWPHNPCGLRQLQRLTAEPERTLLSYWLTLKVSQ